MFENSQNSFENSQWIAKNIVVPKSQNAEAALIQVGIAKLVALAIGMLPTVRFDDQYSLEADEVCNPWPERHLPTEFNI